MFFFLCFFLFTWNIFFCLAFCSSLIWLDIQARDLHLKTLWGHSESTGALGHSESTRRALGHLMHLGTRTIMAHGHLEGTWELGGHSGTRRALKALRQSRHSGTRGTWALEAIYLADSNFPQFHEHIFRSSRCRRSSKYVLLKIWQYLELKSDSNTGVFL